MSNAMNENGAEKSSVDSLNLVELYRVFFEEAPDGMLAASPNGQFIVVNRRGVGLTGYSHEELLGMTFADIISPENLARDPLSIDDLRAGKIVTKQRDILRKDGSLLPVESSTRMLPDGHFLVIFRDITERVQHELASREMQQRLFNIIEFLPDATFVIDQDKRIIAWNRACEEMTGVKKEAMLGQGDFAYAEAFVGRRQPILIDLLDLSSPDMEAFYKYVKRVGNTIYAESFIPRLRGGQGAHLWGVAAPLFDQEGRRCGAIEVVRDVTEHKQAEEAVRESEQKYRELVEGANSIILRLTREGKISFLNEFGQRFFGYSAEEILGRHVIDTIVPPIESTGRDLRQIMEQICADPTPFSDNVNENIRRNGERVWINWANRTVLDSQGQPAEILCVGTDITERKKAEQRIQKLDSLQTAIRRINEALLKIDSEQQLFNQVCLFLSQVEFIRFCWIGIADKESLELKPSAYAGFEDGFLSTRRARYDNSLSSSGPVARAAKNRRPIIIADTETDPTIATWRDEALKRGYASILAVPLVDNDELAGVIAIYSDKRDAFEDEEVEFLVRVAGDIAVGLRTLRLRRQNEKGLADLSRAFQAVTKSLSTALEKRDPYTAGHAERVTKLACAIATEMGLSQEQIEGLTMGGILHDIGKIYVPSEILSKPGKLSPIEFDLIKTHALVGYEILKDTEFPWPVAQMALQHHERMDGKGYPQGLSGENILLEARILGVADVVEAMASHRPYRAALGIPAALKEVSDKKGKLFDPDAVDACMKLFYEKEFKFE